MTTKPKAPKPAEKQRHAITEAAIKAWVSEASAAGRNRLFYDDHKDAPRGFSVRVTKAGAVAFVLSYYSSGAEHRATVGRYPALSITAARRKASVMRDRINAGGDPVTEKKAARAAAIKAKEEAKRRDVYTLGALLDAYVEQMKADGKASWQEVASMLKRHVTDRHPKISARPAAEITVDAVMPIFHPLAIARKYPQSRKLRAAMRAAYTAARKARNNASMAVFAGFEIRANPLDDLDVTPPKEAAEQADEKAMERKWALSVEQLAAYWRRIQADESPRGAMLRFHLLTGGQRVKQLSRLTVRDYDAGTATVTIRDTKGRRRVAYKHVVPLIPDAVAALESMRGSEPRGDALFTVTRGKEAVVYHTVWESVQEIAGVMVAAGEIDRLFTPGTIRKTVETRLQALGMTREVRAHLLSHGLGGVQGKNYEAHDFDAEKRDVLKKLRRLCEPKGKPDNVTPIRRKA